MRRPRPRTTVELTQDEVLTLRTNGALTAQRPVALHGFERTHEGWSWRVWKHAAGFARVRDPGDLREWSPFALELLRVREAFASDQEGRVVYRADHPAADIKAGELAHLVDARFWCAATQMAVHQARFSVVVDDPRVVLTGARWVWQATLIKR